MNRKISIFLPNLHGGGAERVAVNLANDFITKGFSVDLVLLKAEGVFLSEVDPAVRIISLNSLRIRSSLIPLAKYMRVESPDALIANMWPMTGIALIARMISRRNLKVMVVEHTNWKYFMNKYSTIHNLILKYSMRRLLSRADSIVTVSKGAADDLSELTQIPRDKISVIYNPIVSNFTLSDVGLCHLPKWQIGTHKRIIALGSFKTEKNYILLLNAFSLIVKKVDVRLLILGEGEIRFLLESVVMELGLSDLVFLPGFVTNPQAFICEADLFVLSSDFEGFGNVVVEALHAGTPVVSTDCPSGPREILEDGKYGILTPVGDAEALASAVLMSLRSSHDKEALKARAQDFTIAKAADKYLDLLFPE